MISLNKSLNSFLKVFLVSLYFLLNNFLDKYNLDEIEKDGKKIPNPDKDEGINGFELFFWADTYTDNLKNETEETKFDYISQISQNILFIEADKENVEFALQYNKKNHLYRTKI